MCVEMRRGLQLYKLRANAWSALPLLLLLLFYSWAPMRWAVRPSVSSSEVFRLSARSAAASSSSTRPLFASGMVGRRGMRLRNEGGGPG
jgi:hypothetical protein